MYFQSPAEGVDSFEVNIILSEDVPIAINVPLFWIIAEELTFTVTPASIVKVTPLETRTFPG